MKAHSATCLAALTTLAAFASPAIAQTPATPPEPFTFTGNVGIYSQYIFRGLTQTDRKPALQGGFDVAHTSGFYAGTWASNISWLHDAGVVDHGASLEWDFYGGYKYAITEDWGLDVGVLQYWYPGSYHDGVTKPNTTELYAALNWKMLKAKYSYAVTDTFGFPNSDGSYYVEGNLNWDVVEKVNDYFGKVTLIGHVGYQSYKNNGDYSYTDWKAGVSTDFLGVTVGFAVTGTDATSALYTNRFGKDISDTQYIVWAQKTF